MSVLDEYGLRIWSHVSEPYTVQRAYDWVDRVIVIDESKGRRVIDDTKFSTFDFTNWREWDKEEYNRVIQSLKENAE